MCVYTGTSSKYIQRDWRNLIDFISNLLQENAAIPFIHVSQRNQSSIRGTKESDHAASNNSTSNLGENTFTKPNVAKSSYKTVKLAYISYEKKNQDKVINKYTF